MGLLQKAKDLAYIAVDRIKKAFVRVKDALTRFFEKALNMMKVVVDKLAGRVRGVIMGSAHFVRKIGNRYQEGTRNFSLEEEIGQWNETIVTRDITYDEVPPEYRTMEEEFEINDTAELNNSLEF